jgi:hypothetical protein
MRPRSLARSTFPSVSLVRAIPALSIVVLPFTSGSNATVHAAASSLSFGTSALVMSLNTTLVLSVSLREGEGDRRRDGGSRIPRTCPYERVFTGTIVGGRGALPSPFRLAALAGRCNERKRNYSQQQRESARTHCYSPPRFAAQPTLERAWPKRVFQSLCPHLCSELSRTHFGPPAASTLSQWWGWIFCRVGRK